MQVYRGEAGDQCTVVECGRGLPRWSLVRRYLGPVSDRLPRGGYAREQCSKRTFCRRRREDRLRSREFGENAVNDRNASRVRGSGDETHASRRRDYCYQALPVSHHRGAEFHGSAKNAELGRTTSPASSKARAELTHMQEGRTKRVDAKGTDDFCGVCGHVRSRSEDGALSREAWASGPRADADASSTPPPFVCPLECIATAVALSHLVTLLCFLSFGTVLV